MCVEAFDEAGAPDRPGQTKRRAEAIEVGAAAPAGRDDGGDRRMASRGVLLQGVDERRGVDRVDADEGDREAGRTRVERGEAVAGRRHPGRAHAQFGQQPHERVGAGVERLEDQRVGHTAREARGRRQGRAARERNLDPEGAAAAGLAGDADAAAHPLDDLLGDGQPEPGAAVVPARRVLGLRERPEQAGQALRRHADARVGDLDAHAGDVRAGGKPRHVRDDAAAGRELDRVAQQVDEHLAQPRRVAAEASVEAGLDHGGEIDAGGRRLDREQLHGVLDDEPQIEVDRFERDALRFEPGEVENVVDDAEQGVGGRADGVAVLPLLAVERRLGHQLRHADDAVHRRPDFVAHRGEEDALQARLALGAIAGFRELGGPRDDLLLEGGARRVGAVGHARDDREDEAGREPGAQAGGDRRGQVRHAHDRVDPQEDRDRDPGRGEAGEHETGAEREAARRGGVHRDGRGACPDAAPSSGIDGRPTALEWSHPGLPPARVRHRVAA